jgi:hypothetical protein
MGGVRARLAVVPLAVAALTACTSSGRGAPHPTGTAPATPPSAPTKAAAPTTVAAASSCPFVATALVHSTMGMRLGRLTVLRSAGHVVGCRFYALQGSPLHGSEHLPGPSQPAVEVVTAMYPTAVAAHNAFVLAARRGTNPTQVSLGAGRVGVCYQTDFDPQDHGQDGACGISVGRTRVLVRTVDTTGTFNTASVTKAVVGHV